MSSDWVLKAEGLTKEYPLFNHTSDILRYFLFPNSRRIPKFRALHDVSFTVKKGEAVGLIGKNGAGKSTLLQLLAGILEPTDGQLMTRGNVLAILELGAGFQPEFTGLENIYLYGSVLGLKEQVIARKVEQVIAFSELGDKIHQPVKTYSSGMYVRLAFAVTTMINPQLLILDEALAVGDVRFQAKCFQRLKQLKAEGCTIILVSHQHETIFKHCDRALLLDNGQLLEDGTPNQVIGRYLELMNQVSDETAHNHGLQFDSQKAAIGNGKALIDSIDLEYQSNVNPKEIQTGGTIRVRIRLNVQEDIHQPMLSIRIKDSSQQTISGTNTELLDAAQSAWHAGESMTFIFECDNGLTSGKEYLLTFGIHEIFEEKKQPVDVRLDVLTFRVTGVRSTLGLVDFNWKVSQ